MMNTQRNEYATRDNLMKLLSDEEVARVSTAETAAQLADGDEYVDLEMLGGGVRKATGKGTTPMGRVLPRKAVLEATWRKILLLLAARPGDRGGAPAS